VQLRAPAQDQMHSKANSSSGIIRTKARSIVGSTHAQARATRACLLLLAVLLLPSGVNVQAEGHQPRVAGRITALLPEDQVLREGQTLTAAKDMVLEWRDVVKTEKGGRVRIELSDGSVLNVGSEAQLRILKHDPQHQQTTLELLYGRLLATAVRIAKPYGKFDVRTPVAVAGVVGTQFGLRVDPNSTDVVCREGSVRVRSVTEIVVGEVVIHAGEFTHVERGKPPTPPAPASPERLRAGDEATAIPNSP
jgi:ferric-dicitrate binding protein FerR (iron transport regulator)